MTANIIIFDNTAYRPKPLILCVVILSSSETHSSMQYWSMAKPIVLLRRTVLVFSKHGPKAHPAAVVFMMGAKEEAALMLFVSDFQQTTKVLYCLLETRTAVNKINLTNSLIPHHTTTYMKSYIFF